MICQSGIQTCEWSCGISSIHLILGILGPSSLPCPPLSQTAVHPSQVGVQLYIDDESLITLTSYRLPQMTLIPFVPFAMNRGQRHQPRSCSPLEPQRLPVPSPPRLRNAKGLATESFILFAGLCDQHRTETTIIPDGLKQGWPREIDFDALPHRLMSVKHCLADVISTPTTSSFYHGVVKDFEELGSIHASSIHGQTPSISTTRDGKEESSYKCSDYLAR